ncbi:MAG: hypothetical protein HeimC3_51910 [Candidatus Heimdallarchaeota archaeon LC_3]|nr:MAG: hypothetical protein HeimC3_51910 [Candidatus Heimdallarchaeota archaeon LC_3]
MMVRSKMNGDLKILRDLEKKLGSKIPNIQDLSYNSVGHRVDRFY